MTTNNYPIAPNFPNGLNLPALKLEMPTVWPADLRRVSYTLLTRPSGPRGVTKGVLQIDTPRDLTRAEKKAAKAHFQTHAGGRVRPGLRGSQLSPAGEAAGTWTFIADEPQSGGAGLGCVVYSDGTNWRRISDDALASTV